jgi:uncharacterized DUF497 family protein
MAKFVFVEWLLYWLMANRDPLFDWDFGNMTKSKAKHGIETFEIEAVFSSPLSIPLGVQVEPKVIEERLALLGPNHQGKLLHVVFTLRDGRVRPISGRVANKKERKLYGQILRKITEGI